MSFGNTLLNKTTTSADRKYLFQRTGMKGQGVAQAVPYTNPSPQKNEHGTGTPRNSCADTIWHKSRITFFETNKYRSLAYTKHWQY